MPNVKRIFTARITFKKAMVEAVKIIISRVEGWALFQNFNNAKCEQNQQQPEEDST